VSSRRQNNFLHVILEDKGSVAWQKVTSIRVVLESKKTLISKKKKRLNDELKIKNLYKRIKI
jgi:hypothetical protein